MRFLWIAVATMAFVAGPAASTDRLVDLGELAPGYTYYNRPGATIDGHNRELAECTQRTLNWHFGPPPSPGGLLYRGLLDRWLWDGPMAGVEAAQVENCMIVRGWRVVDIGASRGRDLSHAPIGALSEVLAQEIASPSPSGVVVRKWGNEALRPGSFTVASRPRTPSNQQLSLRLYAESAPPPLEQLPWPGQPVIDPSWPKGRLKHSELGRAPAGSGIILVRIAGTSMAFARMGETPDDMPALRDHAPGIVIASISPLKANKEGDWFAFAVPPGRWRISPYCFGSPAFEVEAGEIVYAGAFRPQPDLTPDLSMEAALAWLGSEFAPRARPASYRNGTLGSCRGIEAVLYALEFPGAPFDAGYSWGSAASKRETRD